MFNTTQELAADIARELRQHPDHWTTGCCARNSEGDPTGSTCNDAVCWCLYGHIVKRHGDGFIPEERLQPFFEAAGADWESEGFSDINDNSTVIDIIAICDKVATLNS